VERSPMRTGPVTTGIAPVTVVPVTAIDVHVVGSLGESGAQSNVTTPVAFARVARIQPIAPAANPTATLEVTIDADGRRARLICPAFVMANAQPRFPAALPVSFEMMRCVAAAVASGRWQRATTCKSPETLRLAASGTVRTFHSTPGNTSWARLIASICAQ